VSGKKEFVVPLAADELQWIYISISEPSAGVTTRDYAVEIQSLILEFDEAIGEYNGD
jgi:hypothetical protein